MDRLAPYILTPDDKYIVFPGSKHINVCELETGDIHKKFQYHDRHGDLSIRCLAVDKEGDYLAVGVKFGKPRKCKRNWRRQSCVFLISLKEQKQLSCEKVEGRQHVLQVYFVNDDKYLVSVYKDKIRTYKVPEMSLLYSTEHLGDIHQEALTISSQTNCLLAGVVHDKYVKLLSYDFKNNKHTFSAALDKEQRNDNEKCSTPFAICLAVNNDKVLLGHSNSSFKSANTKFTLSCIPLTKNNIIINTHITGRGTKAKVHSLCVNKNWSLAFAGWQDGCISIVDLNRDYEIKKIQLHTHNINDIKLLEDDTKLLTLSQDHHVKICDIQSLCEGSDDFDSTESMLTASGYASQDSEGYDSCPSSQDSSSNIVQDTKMKNGIGLKRSSEETPAFPKRKLHRTDNSTPSLNVSPRAQFKSSISQDSAIDSPLSTPIIGDLSKEECLHIATNNEIVFTCPVDGNDVFKLWSLETGQLIPGYHEFNKRYKHSLVDNGIEFNHKTHGMVYSLGKYDNGELVIYERKQRNMLCVCCSLVGVFNSIPKIITHYIFKDTFISLIYACNENTNSLTDENNSNRIVIVRNEYVELYSLPEIELLKSIEIRPISDNISDTKSGAGKRKLASYKIAITVDGKYLILANPRTASKYVDVIDLELGHYDDRIVLQNDIHDKFLYNSIYYLIIMKDNYLLDCTDKKLVLKASCLPEIRDIDYKYICPLHVSSSLMSRDRDMGLEIDNHNNVVSLWKSLTINTEKITEFEGHLHDITTAIISHNNRYVLTGSIDKTIRLWGIKSGQCLCLFHVGRSVDLVQFSPSGNYVTCLYYDAPQRKRTLIFNVKNLILKS